MINKDNLVIGLKVYLNNNDKVIILESQAVIIEIL